MARPAGFKIRHWTEEELGLVAETVASIPPSNRRFRSPIYQQLAERINRSVRAIKNKWQYELKAVE